MHPTHQNWVGFLWKEALGHWQYTSTRSWPGHSFLRSFSALVRLCLATFGFLTPRAQTLTIADFQSLVLISGCSSLRCRDTAKWVSRLGRAGRALGHSGHFHARASAGKSADGVATVIWALPIRFSYFSNGWRVWTWCRFWGYMALVVPWTSYLHSGQDQVTWLARPFFKNGMSTPATEALACWPRLGVFRWRFRTPSLGFKTIAWLDPAPLDFKLQVLIVLWSWSCCV